MPRKLTSVASGSCSSRDTIGKFEPQLAAPYETNRAPECGTQVGWASAHAHFFRPPAAKSIVTVPAATQGRWRPADDPILSGRGTLARLPGQGLVTDEELAGFTPELWNSVEWILTLQEK